MSRGRYEENLTSSFSMSNLASFLILLLLLAKDKHVLGSGVLERELVLCRQGGDSAFAFEI